jgi:hypothetical protein
MLCVSAGCCQRALVLKSEMIRIQVGNHNKLIMVAVYGTPCAIPASNSNVSNKGRPTGISLLVYILLDGKESLNKNLAVSV